MSIHLISLAILVVFAVAAVAYASNWFRGRRPSLAPAIAATAHAERVVVMPTAGGRL